MIKHWKSWADMPADLSAETQARSVYAGLPLTETLRLNECNGAVKLLTDQDWDMITEQVEQAGRSEIITKDGAIIYIEQTRAAVMIDIDNAVSKVDPSSLIEGHSARTFCRHTFASASRKNSC